MVYNYFGLLLSIGLAFSSCKSDNQDNQRERTFKERAKKSVEAYEGVESVQDFEVVDTFRVEDIRELLPSFKETREKLRKQQERLPSVIDSNKAKIEKFNELMTDVRDELVEAYQSNLEKLKSTLRQNEELVEQGEKLIDHYNSFIDFMEESIEKAKNKVGYYRTRSVIDGDTLEHAVTPGLDVYRLDKGE